MPLRLPQFIMEPIDWHTTTGHVRDDGFLLKLRLLCKPRKHILSQGDKHPIFRGQVSLLFDSDLDPDFNFEYLSNDRVWYYLFMGNRQA